MEAFLDTEWADPAGAQLVSLALVSADSRQVFYAEVDPLPDSPTDFVTEQVYPRLRRGSSAMCVTALARALNDFVREAGLSKVICDHPVDRKFFEALMGSVAENTGIRAHVSVEVISDPVLRLLVEDYFAAHSKVSAERHNAFVDATVLKMAWDARVGRTEAPWSPSSGHINFP